MMQPAAAGHSTAPSLASDEWETGQKRLLKGVPENLLSDGSSPIAVLLY